MAHPQAGGDDARLPHVRPRVLPERERRVLDTELGESDGDHPAVEPTGQPEVDPIVRLNAPRERVSQRPFGVSLSFGGIEQPPALGARPVRRALEARARERRPAVALSTARTPPTRTRSAPTNRAARNSGSAPRSSSSPAPGDVCGGHGVAAQHVKARALGPIEHRRRTAGGHDPRRSVADRRRWPMARRPSAAHRRRRRAAEPSSPSAAGSREPKVTGRERSCVRPSKSITPATVRVAGT